MLQLSSLPCVPSPSKPQPLHGNLQLPGYFFPEISWETCRHLTVGYHGHFYSEDLWNTLCCMVGSSMAKSVRWGVQDGMICPSTETLSWAKAATHKTGIARPLLNNACHQLQYGVHLQNPNGQPHRAVLQQKEGVRDVVLISWSLYALPCLKQAQLSWCPQEKHLLQPECSRLRYLLQLSLP